MPSVHVVTSFESHEVCVSVPCRTQVLVKTTEYTNIQVEIAIHSTIPNPIPRPEQMGVRLCCFFLLEFSTIHLSSMAPLASSSSQENPQFCLTVVISPHDLSLILLLTVLFCISIFLPLPSPTVYLEPCSPRAVFYRFSCYRAIARDVITLEITKKNRKQPPFWCT